MLDDRKHQEAKRILEKMNEKLNLKPVSSREDLLTDAARARLVNCGFNLEERIEYLLNIIENECLR